MTEQIYSQNYSEEIRPESLNDLDKGKSLDEIYHDQMHNDYVDMIASETDYLMMQYKEGLI